MFETKLYVMGGILNRDTPERLETWKDIGKYLAKPSEEQGAVNLFIYERVLAILEDDSGEIADVAKENLLWEFKNQQQAYCTLNARQEDLLLSYERRLHLMTGVKEYLTFVAKTVGLDTDRMRQAFRMN